MVGKLVAALSFSLLVMTFGSQTALRAQSSEPQALVQQWQQGLLHGDLDAALVPFVDNVAISDPLVGVLIGKANYHAGLAAAFAANPDAEIHFSATVVELNTVLWRTDVTSSVIRAAGVAHVRQIETAVTYQGQIVSLTAVWDLSDADTVQFVQAMSGV